MAGFLMKQMVGNQLNEVTGGLGIGGGDQNAEKTAEGEDPEVGTRDFYLIWAVLWVIALFVDTFVC